MNNPAVLMLSKVYGKLKGGISTIYRRLAQVLREHEPDIPVVSAVLEATDEDREDATHDKVELLLPEIQIGDQRTKPDFGWMTFDHRAKYPHLPSKVKAIVGHTDGTSRAACRIKQDRCPGAKVILFIDDIPEETEQYKGDEEAMGIGKKEDSILKDAEEADTVFSVGNRIFDHFENQFRAIPANERPQHIRFVPRPSCIFEHVDAEYKDTGTMVVLCISRVAGVEKLNGLDLAVDALSIVAEKKPITFRVWGVNKEDKQAIEAIRELRKSANLEITFLPYGTQKDICKNMKQAHLVLVPSRAEPFGFVGLEAIAAGVPVLVSDKSGLANLINTYARRYHNCIVKTDVRGNEQRNAAHWADCIEKVLEHCKEEFDTAAQFKKDLLDTRYWEESERQFIDACICEGASSATYATPVPNIGIQSNEGPFGSSSDEESLQENYRLLRISEKIFDEEVLNDPEQLESRLLDFREHVDDALHYFKLSCRAKLRVQYKVKHHYRKVHSMVFSRLERDLRSFPKMRKCFKLFSAILKKIEDGCVLCTLEFEDIPHLVSFLRAYRDGKLSETLTQELITEELKQEGETDLYIHVTLLVARDTSSSGNEPIEHEAAVKEMEEVGRELWTKGVALETKRKKKELITEEMKQKGETDVIQLVVGDTSSSGSEPIEHEAAIKEMEEVGRELWTKGVALETKRKKKPKPKTKKQLKAAEDRRREKEREEIGRQLEARAEALKEEKRKQRASDGEESKAQAAISTDYREMAYERSPRGKDDADTAKGYKDTREDREEESDLGIDVLDSDFDEEVQDTVSQLQSLLNA
ncbi:PREDICTED: uncharacterized protein LOC109483324 [Branchiostoma belcheri]|uniref:Uncharacterized protein LOC109483324 n=1 Tax=Branchiostoma belcheri TaxID=7741 RepID=A0A6P5AIU5_BRABE|nr:PREDICTED: uncharacterized protein LOC109483324 [Branchiostoma belcheri]